MYCDIVCQVIDNLGDVGVSWRLAVQLAKEHGWQVRFWIDQPALLEHLCPHRSRTKVAIDVLHWQPTKPIGFKSRNLRCDVLITSFCAKIHDDDISDLAHTKVQWVHLEYFSCEEWVPGFHLMRSPHPRFNITKTIWVPSLLTNGGGVIRENTLTLSTSAQQTQKRLAQEIKLFFFTYPHAYLSRWLQDLLIKSHIHIDLASQTHYDSIIKTINNSRIKQSEFVPQIDFDRHLQQYDLVWVRGEDSVMRALLNGVPFVWHIYPQDDSAHTHKLSAFFEAITCCFDADSKQALWQIWCEWNENQPPSTNISELIHRYQPLWRNGLHRYLETLFSQQDLADQLVLFIGCK